MTIIYYAILVSFFACDISATNAICNKFCDGSDPNLASEDRQTVSVEVLIRKIVLHISEADNMFWASINNGYPEDEVWLDRSFDGGLSWNAGSKLGDTEIPTGHYQWRTLMYNIDDPQNQNIGSVRTCGKPGNKDKIRCTQWMRSKMRTINRITNQTKPNISVIKVGIINQITNQTNQTKPNFPVIKVEIINQITNQTKPNIPVLEENTSSFIFIIIISVLFLFVIIFGIIIVVIYRKISKKHENFNSPKIDTQNRRKSVTNIYEDVDYNEFALDEYYGNSKEPNMYIQIVENT